MLSKKCWFILVVGGCIVAVLSLCTPAQAGWESRHVYKDAGIRWAIGGAIVTHGLDVHTTNRGLNRGYHETNPILGRDPGTEELIALKLFGFAVAGIATEVIERTSWAQADKLKWQQGFWSVFAMGGAIPAYQNYSKVGF